MENEDDLFARWEQEMQVMPCESAVHDSSPAHEGTGEWYATFACPRCHTIRISMLVCDRFNSLIPSMMIVAGSSVIECGKCEQQFLYRETIVVSERRQV